MQVDNSATQTRRPISRGLRFRVAAVLALALLPIGVMGMFQNRNLAEEVSNRTELTLLALTDRAAFGERQVIERAFGAAEALSVVLKLIRDDPESCRRYLSDYLETTNHYTFIGFVGPDYEVRCSSAGTKLDFTDRQKLTERMASAQSSILSVRDPAVSSERVLNILYPALQDGDLIGYISISMPVRLVVDREDASADGRPRALITFNAQGEILSSQTTRKDGVVPMPENVALAALAGSDSTTFSAMDQFGKEHSFALVPMIPDLVYALGVWPPGQARGTWWSLTLSPGFIPLMMFIASLGVAYLAVDRLVVGRVSLLRAKMREFTRTRQFEPEERRQSTSSELEDLEQSFTDMAFGLMADEAKMEDALREKNVLLKEVHHRVKNNLQLISSIMNMQIRKARSPETQTVLRRLQDRILGLSTIHRNLYQTENLNETNAGVLLSDLFKELIVSGAAAGSNLDYEGDFEEVIVFPDQAVPLSLLASELATNALKYVAPVGGARPWIRASLKVVEPGISRLICENSRDRMAEKSDEERSGLGTQLIRAFAAQLGGDLQVEETDTVHTTVVTFKVEDFSHELADH